MKRKDTGRRYHKQSHYQQLLEAVGRWLPAKGLPLQVDNAKIRWSPRMLAIAAILMSWAPDSTLKDRFARARQALVGMYPTRKRPGETYEGFIASLAKQTVVLLAVICPALRQAVREMAGEDWLFGGRLLYGVDGSRDECTMTRANEQAFRCGGKKKTTPQQYIVTLVHLGTGLVWDWRRGDAKASERALLLQMLALLPAGSMLVADAGYTGYRMLQELQEQGMEFLIRVGANVRLLKGLGYRVREHEGIVYLWPQRERNKKMEPLRLRLIRLHDGRKEICLLTSVLDRKQLSDAQAGRIYRRRWGLELMYRALKQTMERRKMLSDAPRHAEVELDWSMMGLWMLSLISLEALRRQGHPPGAWSVAASLRVVRRAADDGDRRCRRNGLRDALGGCVKDTYERSGSKASRHGKNKKRERPPGVPKIRTADPSEVLLAQQLRKRKQAA